MMYVAIFIQSENDNRHNRRRRPLSLPRRLSLARPRLGLRSAPLWLPQIRLNIRVDQKHVGRQSETQPTDQQHLLPYLSI